MDRTIIEGVSEIDSVFDGNRAGTVNERFHEERVLKSGRGERVKIVCSDGQIRKLRLPAPPETRITRNIEVVQQRLIGPHFSGSDDKGKFFDDPDLGHRLCAPLEISQRASFSGGSSRSSSPSAPIPENSASLFRICTKNIGFGRKRFRRVIAIVAATIGAILVASGSLMMRDAFKSTDPLATEDNKAHSIDAVELLHGNGNDEPNPPRLPASLKLFFPPRNEDELQAMQTTLQEYSDPILTWEDFSNNAPRNEGYPSFTYTSEKHFSSRRAALLFAPGTYPNLDFQVGYYTSVIGLGPHPSDVKFTDCDKGPHCPALERFTNRPPHGSGLDTFWRSIENIATDAREGMKWAVSQAAPLRRIHVQTDLNLYDGDSWVSGGVASNMLVDGIVNFGGQQQWLMRNVELTGGGVNGAWSLVFVGSTGNVPKESDGMVSGPSISVENNHIRVEKPYLVLNTVDRSMTHESLGGLRSNIAPADDKEEIDHAILSHQFELRVPSVNFGKDAIGPQFEDTHEDIRKFQRVKLGVPSNSTDPKAAAAENHSVLQKALNDGKDLVLSPGIYPLSHSLNIRHDNQVILGLGYATLVAPENGSPCIRIQPRVAGVRIAGVMLEASALKDERNSMTKSLLEWGSPTVDDPGVASNPGVLSDVFARVGGVRRDVSTDVMIQINSGNIYGDNLWLWRADHVQLHPDEEPNFPHISPKYKQTQRGECEAKNGLVINTGASNVTIVGLAVEHTTEDQTIWNGNGGQVYFYQCESPYDVDHTFGDNKYVGYRVGPQVTSHKASGLGIYSNFRDYDVKVETAIVHSATNDNIEMKNIFTVKLDNQGEILSVINGQGPGPKNETEKGRPFRCSDGICSNEN